MNTMSPAPVAPGTAVRRLAGVDRGDRLVFSRDDPHRLDPDLVTAERLAVVRDAVAHHLERSTVFAAMAERRGFALEDLQADEDLARVPQVPTLAFKRGLEWGRSPGSHRQFTSSGTTGLRSFVPRDDVTLARLVGSLRRGIEMVTSISNGVDVDGDMVAMHLGPPPPEAGDLWIAYVIGLVEVLLPTTHWMRDGALQLGDAASALRGHVAAGRTVALFGTPAAIRRLADEIVATGSLGERAASTRVITGGGWKQAVGEALAPGDLLDLLRRALGPLPAAHVRDAFNQVELNTLLMECEHHRKHIPPWLKVIVRSPRDLAPVPDGVEGLLTWLDASPTSYPGFLVGEDLGMVNAGACPCGRTSPALRHPRRIIRPGHQGCSLQLDSRLTSNRP